MNASTRRKVQILLSIVILTAAVIISYYSVVETQVAASGGYTDVCLVLDTSGSMGDPSPGGISTKLEDAKRSASEFVNTIKPDVNSNFTIGLIAFDDEVQELSGLTQDAPTLLSAIDSLTPGGRTAMSDALRSASELLVKEGRPRAQRVILLMTDGITNADQYSNPDDATAFAKSNGIVVYTVGFGSDADTTLLENIAQSTGGQYYLAGTGAELVQAFGTVARTLLGVSAPAHYGSRAMILLALPLIIFMPQIEKGVTQAYSGLTTMLRRQPTVVKPRYQKWSVCTRCEKPVRPGATYCHSCGLRLSPMTTAYQRCQECGRPLRSGARFCTKCGTRAKPHLE